ncbi:MAG: S-layer homology domain-containing protein, partial [Firmicutes bacterium]|nr:S-layer homology domain-containing protein [Bacillota bacterium]
VMWAVNHKPQITNGTDPTHFSPNQNCTRAHVVTFMWRAAGAPEPSMTYNQFKDVKSSDYYYKAVLWAVENSITKGTSADTFSPDNPCKRCDVVTFLWRWRGTQEPEGTLNPFVDLVSGAYYYKAVLWAYNHKPMQITSGTSPNEFSPEATCTRGQIVTFLYREQK